MEIPEPANNTITYVNGDIFSAAVEALVNPVNCMGTMGAGLAKQFKHKFPGNFAHYKDQCSKGFIMPGVVDFFRTGYRDYHNFIINFPTKLHWKNPSQLVYIDKGLRHVKDLIEQYEIISIALPELGCGLGGLDFKDVKPLIEQYLGSIPNLNVKVFHYDRTN